MDNKDQLNQIPGEENIDNRDEKTSQSENPNVETSPKDESAPVEKKPEAALSNPEEEKTSTATTPDEHSDDSLKGEEIPEQSLAETDDKPEPSASETEDGERLEDQESPAEEKAAEALANPEEEKTATAEVPDQGESLKGDEIPEQTPQGQTNENEAAKEDQDHGQGEDATGENTAKKAKADDAIKDMDKDDEEEEDDEDEIVHEGEIIDYDALGREELVDRLEELVNEDDVNKIKSNVALIKVAYLKKTKEEKEALIDETLAKEKEEDKDEKEDTDGKDDKAEATAVEEPEVAEDKIETRYRALFDIYRQKRAIYLENFEKQKLVNLQRKKDILEELKNLISSEETLKKTYDDFRDLQEAWKTVGMVPKGEVNNLWQNYHFLVEKFFDKVKINKELKDLDMKKNLEQKIELCEKAEELLLENSIIKSFKELQNLHDQWKEVGPVPTEKNEDLWERFKSTTDKINQRRRDHYKKLQDEHDNNYEAKTGLCEKAEQLLAEEVNSIREWQNKTRQFNELFKVWKTIGPASKKQNDEIWEKFKSILDAFFNEKKEYFGKLKDQQINNYNLKLDLCVRAEAIKDSDDWKQTTFDLINFQKEWKNIGPVPRKHSDKIWKRFRSACDTFFERKNKHFSHIREDETENLKKKEALIKQVEETVFDTDRSENLNKLKAFQRQWTEIGFVPFKEKDRLQNEFRSAVDKQLDKLNISSAEISLDNYKSKMEVLKGSQDGNKSLGRERNFIQGKINQLRDDVNVWENNIGFLADTKKASLFKTEFEKKIVKAKKELEVLEEKLRFLDK